MRRHVLALALTLATLAAPRAHAECSSVYPVADPHAASVTCAGAGVGRMLLVPSLKWGDDYPCAASYAFADQFGNRYLTLPGSCYLDYACLEDAAYDALPPPLNQLVPRVPVCLNPGESEDEPVFRRGGPVVTDTNHAPIGRIVYAVKKDEVDFALLKVDAKVRIDPSVPFYGGPVRIGVAGTLEEARVYSPPWFDTPNANVGYLHGNSEQAWVYTVDGVTYPGTTVERTNGEAIGFFLPGNEVGNGDNTQPLGEAIARAQRHTGLRLRLLTAPLRK